MTMNGNERIYRQRRRAMRRYIRKHNPLKKQPPLDIDIHAYFAYKEEHNIKNEDVTPEIVGMFRVRREPQIVEKKNWVIKCLNRISGLF